MTTITVKKDFVEIVNFLDKNKDKKVSDILSTIMSMCESKKKDITTKKNDKGEVVEIFCYYHKVWEPVSWYGEKSTSNTGLNTMCKVGVNQWTKQQADAKKAKSEILDRVSTGELKPTDIQKELEKIEEKRLSITSRSDYLKMKKESETKKETKK